MTHRPLCDLCGLPVPTTAACFTSTYSDTKNSYQFCCLGCKQVFTMIAELSDGDDPATFKETELFKQCQDLGIIPRSEADLENFSWHQDRKANIEDTFNLQNVPENHMTLSLKITDMWCPACAWFIETALQKEPGIHTANCNFAIDRLQIAYDPAVTSPVEVISTLKDLGYNAVALGETEDKKQTRVLFVRLMISALLTANIMMLSFSAYSGFFIQLTRDAVWKISWPVCLMAAVVLFYGGRPIYLKALANIRVRSFGMETLITAGAFTAFGYSLFNLISGNVHIYFDTASMLITLTLLGKLLEKRVKNRVTSDLDLFFSIRPKKAKVCSDLYPMGRYTAIENLSGDDTVWVEAEDIVPADGMVTQGSGYVDESVITGESRMVKKQVGDELIGGTSIVSGGFKFRVAKIGEASVIGEMMAVMENTLNRKSPVELYTEKILKWFVPLIISLAIGTGMICFFAGHPANVSIIRAVTVMVIACPCALGIAIPLVRVAGISIAGKSGILIRNFESFDQAKDIDTVVFDKTGTLTAGRWKLIKVLTAECMTEDQALQMALGLEAHCDHDISVALKGYAASKGVPPEKINSIAYYENGISGKIKDKLIKIGSRTFVEEGLLNRAGMDANLNLSEDLIYSPVYLCVEKKIASVFVFGDMIRPDAPGIVARFKEKDLGVYLVSGDEKAVVDGVAKKLKIEKAFGGQLPLDKSALVTSLKSKGRKVMMVGDGINDAPAMACSDVSIGVTAKSLLSQENADITLMKEDLSGIITYMAISENVRRKIRQNFWFSFVYNFISIPIAMSGVLTPLIAVTAMLLSSLTVIGNTLLLFRETRNGEQ